MAKAKKQTHTIKIHCDNKKAAKHFLTWLCESGEQDYWIWMECREREEKGDITITGFDYFPNNAKKFADGLEIVGECGRLDDDETADFGDDDPVC